MGFGRVLASTACGLTLSACALLSGVGDLQVEATLDGGTAVAADGGAGRDSSSAPTDGATADASPDQSATDGGDGAVPYARKVTFENGSLTGPLGADSVGDLPQLVTGALAISGNDSMRVTTVGQYARIVYSPHPEMFLAALINVAATPLPDNGVVVASVQLDGTHTATLSLFLQGLSVMLGLAVDSTSIGAVSADQYGGKTIRVGVHFRAGSGNGLVEVFIAEAPPFVFPTTAAMQTTGATFTTVDAISVGSIGGDVTARFDDIFASSASMP